MNQVQSGFDTQPTTPKLIGPAQLQVLIADDHVLILEIIAMVLDNTPDIHLHTAVSISDATQRLQDQGRFDLILLDLDMPGMKGVETMHQIRSRNHGAPIGILTGGPTPAVVAEFFAQGAAGLVPKTTSLRGLTTAIRLMAAGERYFPPELMLPPPDPSLVFDSLNSGELSVLRLLQTDLPNREISLALNTTEAVVQMHIQAMFRKLSVSTRSDVVRAARDLGLL